MLQQRLLFLSLGPFYYPEQLPIQEKYRLLSARYAGDVFAVLNDPKLNGAKMTAFDLHGMYLPKVIRHRTFLRNICYGIFAVVRGTYLHYFRHRYAAVIAPEPLVSGVIALVLRLLTGAKAVVEVNGQFETAFEFDNRSTSLVARLKQSYVKRVLPFVLYRADAVKLLYPDQVRPFVGASQPRRVHAFADFVSIGQFKRAEPSNYFLFIGYPWLLKGVDILIKAFNSISDEFPDWSLKVVGFCPNKQPFIALANGNPRIELCDPVEYPQVIELMAHCSVFVLPSRTEAMGRVLLEAMAAQKPVIGSNVDGIPWVVQDGRTGLLFESENVGDLAAKMRRLICDPDYRDRLGAHGFDHVHQELSEARFMERFSRMIQDVTAQ
jgi:glycosyltransferase involved in cell wall biosynthesis